jgi:hypothetical protein
MSVSLIGRCSIDQAEALSAKVALPWSCLNPSVCKRVEEIGRDRFSDHSKKEQTGDPGKWGKKV